MFNYSKSLATAQKLLSSFGQDVTVKRIITGTYDTATGSVSNTETTYTAKAVLLDYKRLDAGNGLAGLIQINDKKLLVSPVGLTVAPDANDLVTINSEVWNVVNVKAIKPASIVVLYELQIRKS